MNSELIERLRDDLHEAEYSSAAVRSLLGAAADDARLRGVCAPGIRALDARDETALSALTRILLLGQTVTPAVVELGLPHLGVEGAIELGLVAPHATGLRAALSLNPVTLPSLGGPTVGADETLTDWWVLSDLDDHLRGGPARADHVMGVGGATRSLLAQAPLGLTPADTITSALDLGTGCGIVALALAHAGVPRVVATDISARALRFAQANARLAGLHDRIDLRHGDLFAPVGGPGAGGTAGEGEPERFDLILSNPPFVITPRQSAAVPHYEYRDGGLHGDELVRAVVGAAPPHLAPNGTLLCLANWESHWGIDGLERVGQWITDAAAGRPIAGWVIERDRVDPARYAETWVRDGGARPGTAEFDDLMRAWLEDLEARRVVSIGLGSIRLRNLDTGHAGVRALRAERADAAFSDAPGALLAAAFETGIATAGQQDEAVLAACWLRSPEVTEVRQHEPGVEGPRAIALQTDRPIARSVSADPLLAAAIGACDGELTLGQIAGALASIFEIDEVAVAEALVAGVRELVWLGMLAPADR